MSTNQSSWPDSGQILRHQYGISVAEAQTFLLAKRRQRRTYTKINKIYDVSRWPCENCKIKDFSRRPFENYIVSKINDFCERKVALRI